jgi:putative resolvase
MHICIYFFDMKTSIGRAAQELGVSRDTLRRWEKSGKITVERTPKGHRRYNLALLMGVSLRKDQTKKKTIVYARVSSHDQKADLVRQVQILETFCAANGWIYEVIEDLGSGLNYNKRGLRNLIRAICLAQVDRLVLAHKDRLLRFGSELIFSLCEQFGIEVVIINETESSTFEDDLVQDVLEIITVFSARLYGARSRKNKKLLDALKEAAATL